ncbi:MAG: cyclic-di-AMP phosphodiesterase PgpH [Acidobacteriota bacterium]|jgi:putative nucleotidyltransferase with HDIG domain|nr:cyclic-di-AMP phosphodiesterase PgpH [Acidobacteriota bacterium]
MSSPAPKRPSRIDLLQTGTFRLRRRLQDQRPWQRALETPSLWVVLFLIVGTWALMPGAFLFSPRATPGAIAARDYVASRDLLVWDEDATRTKQEQAREAVLPVYDLDLGALDDLDGRIEQIFVRGRRLLGRSPQAGSAGSDGGTTESPAPAPSFTAQDLLKEIRPEQLRLSDEQAELLVRKRFSAQLEERLRSVATRALRRGVVSNKALLLENRMRGIFLRKLESGAQGTEEIHFDLFDHLGYPGEAREFLDSEIGDWSGYTSRDRVLLADLLFDNLPINLLPNRSETLDRSEAAAAGAGRVFNQIRKGQVIVRKGDVVDAGDARVIAQMRGERQLRMQVPPLAATFFLLALTAAVVWLALSREKVADHGPRRVFGESLLLLLGSLLGAKFCFLVAGALSGAFDAEPLNSARSYTYAVPFASLALLAALLLGRHASLVLSILVSVLASRLAVEGDGQWVIFYGFAGSLAAIYALDRYQFRQRLVMVRVGLVVGVINVLMVLILTALGSAERGWMQIGFDLLCAFVGGLLVTAVASFAVPILESLLAITTDIKLVELANTNLPLLRRLAFEAPGTFQHSLMVANLAKEGCEAIGADPVLAYSAGLYHDVGKVLRPEYFVENQRGGQNRHDKLLPSMSALILLNHVKDGLELAREHGLPQVIQDAIAQHHGTRLIKYFYHRAMEQKDPEAVEVVEDKYRYPGPKPQNKVMGVLMLADAVEAASRTLAEPAPAKIRGLIQTILEDILKDGQLEHTDLTLSDLRTVSDTFLRVLANIFHQRIDYPGFDFNRRADKRASDVGEAGAAARAS